MSAPGSAAAEDSDPPIPFFGAKAAAELAEQGLHVAADGAVTGDPEALQDLAEALAAPAAESFDGDSVSVVDTAAESPPETIGGEGTGEERERRPKAQHFSRHYKIQEVIRRRQIMLIQVVKEERGGKGAALTTYISLAGRFCVLMPNSPRGGGISRKITSAADRRRLKEITTELDLPSGMGLIVRTAGAARPKPEITRDCEYLLQLWDDIRETTLKSVAPALIYEEASLIKRAIRDVYSRDVDEVLVDGEAAWRAAREQMRLLMPSHAAKVQLWNDAAGQPLFAKHQVDVMLDAMMSPNVQLRSGGYLVINQAEALVAIDVNSGRSTKERGIEETALRTNMEAAEEVARQLRLRDLAGLIVIDFIDMEQRRHNAMVERKLKDALKNDRARIQLGTISHFGLMEMSRQRLRPSLTETSFVQCPHCGGAGHVRSTEGSAIQVLRAIEEEGGKRRSAEIMVHVAGPIAMYILNHKRARLQEIETRYGMAVLFTPDPNLLQSAVRIEKLRAHGPGEAPAIPAQTRSSVTVIEDAADAARFAAGFEDDADEPGMIDPAEAPQPSLAPRAAVAASAAAADGSATGEGGKRRRRRRRRGGRREEGPRLDGQTGSDAASADEAASAGDEGDSDEGDSGDDRDEAEAVAAAAPQTPVQTTAPAAESGTESVSAEETRFRRRGRRGGRRRRKDGSFEDAVIEPAVLTAAYTGPTPADPFGGAYAYDIFDALAMAEEAAEAQAGLPSPPPAPPAPPVEPPPAAPDVPPVGEPPEREPAPAPQEPDPAPPLQLEAGAPPPEAAAKPAKRVARPRRTKAMIAAEAAAAEAAAGQQGLLVSDAVVEAPPATVESVEPPAASSPDAAAPINPPANDTEPADAAAALIQPVMVADAPTAPKRGWWKR